MPASLPPAERPRRRGRRTAPLFAASVGLMMLMATGLAAPLAAAQPSAAQPAAASPAAVPPPSVAAATAAAAAKAATPLLGARTRTLDNGLQVVVVEDHRMPVVSHMVWYRVGSADEPPRRSGIAHFLEHLMFKGTDQVAGDEFSRLIAENGGRDNAFTSYDFTAYYQNIAADRLDLVMRLEADRMTGLKLTPEDTRTELQVVIEERRSRTDNDPQARFSEAYRAMLYGGHPYGRPVIGWSAELPTLNRDDALAFYKAHYRPSAAIVVVAGDVQAADVFKLAEATYGRVANDGPAPDDAAPGAGAGVGVANDAAAIEAHRLRPAPAPLIGDRRLVLAEAGVASPTWRRSWLVPGAESFGRDREEALDLFLFAMGGGSNSPLYRRLVVAEGVAVQAGAFYSGARDEGQVMIYAAPAPGVSVAALEAAVEAAVADLLKDGVPADVLERARTRMLADAVYARDSVSSTANLVGGALATGETLDRLETWPERIAAITGEQGLEAARAVMAPPAGTATGILLPEGLGGDDPAPAVASAASAAPSSEGTVH